MIVLIILATAYIAIMYNYSRQKCKAYMADRQENLFDRINNLQKHIDELEEQLSEVLKKKKWKRLLNHRQRNCHQIL